MSVTASAIPTTVSPKQGLFKLTLMNAEVTDESFDDVVVAAIHRGLAPEIVLRLKQIWTKTKMVAGEVVAVGKIVIHEIMKFLKANPQLTVGLALGAAVQVLLASVPVLGYLLGSLGTLLLGPVGSAAGGAYGAGVGAAMQAGVNPSDPMQVAIALATAFFELFKNILNAVSAHFAE